MTTDAVCFGSDRVDSTGAEEALLLPDILFLQVCAACSCGGWEKHLVLAVLSI